MDRGGAWGKKTKPGSGELPGFGYEVQVVEGRSTIIGFQLLLRRGRKRSVIRKSTGSPNGRWAGKRNKLLQILLNSGKIWKERQFLPRHSCKKKYKNGTLQETYGHEPPDYSDLSFDSSSMWSSSSSFLLSFFTFSK